MSNGRTAVFVFHLFFFFFLFQTVGRLSNDATYSPGRNNGGTLFRCCHDGRCSFHPWKKGYKQRDVNASCFFPPLPHVEPITVPPHERDMNRSSRSVAARIERRVTCVDTSTLERTVDSRCNDLCELHSDRSGKIVDRFQTRCIISKCYRAHSKMAITFRLNVLKTRIR